MLHLLPQADAHWSKLKLLFSGHLVGKSAAASDDLMTEAQGPSLDGKP